MSLAGEIFWMISKTYSVLFFLIGISNAAFDCQSFAERSGRKIVEFCSDTTLTNYDDDIVISGYNASGTPGQCECQVESDFIVGLLEFPKRGCGTVLKIQISEDFTNACGEGSSFPRSLLYGQALITLNKTQAPYDAAYCILLTPAFWIGNGMTVSCYSPPPAMLPTNPVVTTSMFLIESRKNISLSDDKTTAMLPKNHVVTTSVSLKESKRIDSHRDRKTLSFNETKEEFKCLSSVQKCSNLYEHSGFVIIAGLAALEFIVIAILSCYVVTFRHPALKLCLTFKTRSHDYVNESIGNAPRAMEMYEGLGRREQQIQYDSVDTI